MQCEASNTNSISKKKLLFINYPKGDIYGISALELNEVNDFIHRKYKENDILIFNSRNIKELRGFKLNKNLNEKTINKIIKSGKKIGVEYILFGYIFVRDTYEIYIHLIRIGDKNFKYILKIKNIKK